MSLVSDDQLSSSSAVSERVNKPFLSRLSTDRRPVESYANKPPRREEEVTSSVAVLPPSFLRRKSIAIRKKRKEYQERLPKNTIGKNMSFSSLVRLIDE